MHGCCCVCEEHGRQSAECKGGGDSEGGGDSVERGAQRLEISVQRERAERAEGFGPAVFELGPAQCRNERSSDVVGSRANGGG